MINNITGDNDFFLISHAQMLHGAGIFTNIYPKIPKNHPVMYNVGPPSYVCWFRFAPVTSSLQVP